MKRTVAVLSLVLALILSFSLSVSARTGGGNNEKFFFYGIQNGINCSTPSGAVEMFLSICKTMDEDMIATFLEADPVGNKQLLGVEAGSDEARMIMAITKGMTYVITDESVNGDTATVRVEITTYSVYELMEGMYEELIDHLESSDYYYDDDGMFITFFTDYFERTDLSLYSRETTAVMVNLHRNAGTGLWVIEENDYLYSVIIGGLDAVLMGFGLYF